MEEKKFDLNFLTVTSRKKTFLIHPFNFFERIYLPLFILYEGTFYIRTIENEITILGEFGYPTFGRSDNWAFDNWAKLT